MDTARSREMSEPNPADRAHLPSPRRFLRTGARLSRAAVIAFAEGPAYHSDGSVYFSDIINNRMMKLAADGQLSVFRADSGRTNGNLFDSRGRLVSCEGCEMGSGGRRRIVRTDLETGRVEVLTERFEGRRYNSPNDLAIDRKGRQGGLLDRIPIPEDVVTNMTFGGSDKKTLYVTAGKSLFKIGINVPGYSLFPR